VPDELRRHLWADDRHMTAGVAAEADVVALITTATKTVVVPDYYIS
jgi:hypothetical protein